jgi:hypothetical protein
MIVWASLAFAGTVDEGAAKLAAGDVTGALATFQEEANQGPASATLAYDFGNAWYAGGDTARAIAWWRLARMLEPRNGDVAHNLAWVRGEKHLPEAAPAPVAFTDFVSPGELAVPSLLFLAVGAVGALASRVTRGRTAAMLPWLGVAGVGIAGVGTAVYANEQMISHPIGVVVDADAHVRTTPAAEADEAFPLPIGAEVQIDGEREGFLRIETGDGRRGWVPAGGLLVVSPEVNPLG